MGSSTRTMLRCSRMLMLIVAAWAIIEEGQEFSNAKTSNAALLNSNDSVNEDNSGGVEPVGVDCMSARSSNLAKKSLVGEEDDDFEDHRYAVEGYFGLAGIDYSGIGRGIGMAALLDCTLTRGGCLDVEHEELDSELQGLGRGRGLLSIETIGDV